MSETEARFVALYDELHAIAERHLRHEPPAALLQPGDLLHEAYLRMAGRPDFRWTSAAAFHAAAAVTMRRVLIDYARQRRARKRGGDLPTMRVEADELLAPSRPIELADLEAALTDLAHTQPQQARIVELRFFGGLSLAQIAEELHLPLHAVRAEWAHARAHLRSVLGPDG